MEGVPMRIPSKKIRREFFLTYELKGAQKAVNLLCRFYGIRRMKVVVDGRKVGKKSWDACYENNVGYFKINSINKNLVLHEFYHHMVHTEGWEMSVTKEEKEADDYAKRILKKF